MVGWLSYGVGNLKSTTSPPHAIEGSVFHVERGCVTCLGWGGVFMGAGLFRSFWFYGDVVVSRETRRFYNNPIVLRETLVVFVVGGWCFGF